MNLRDAYYSVLIHEKYQQYFKNVLGYPLKNKVILNDNGPAMRAFT